VSFQSHVPGSEYYEAPPAATAPTSRMASAARRTVRRRPWEPISQDTDPVRRERRLDQVHRDIALHVTHEPCDRCGHTARLSGGEGCRCSAHGFDLARRCVDAAARARAAEEFARTERARLWRAS